jgi:hypothetical protein
MKRLPVTRRAHSSKTLTRLKAALHRIHKRHPLAYMRQGEAETMSYYGFPREHWRSLRTNNPMERIIKGVRRRTRVVGAFPDGQSAMMLVAAQLRLIAGTQWGNALPSRPQTLRIAVGGGTRWTGPVNTKGARRGLKRRPPPLSLGTLSTSRAQNHAHNTMCEKLWTLRRNFLQLTITSPQRNLKNRTETATCELSPSSPAPPRSSPS